MRKIGEYNAGRVLGQIHPGGNDMDNDVTHTKWWMRLQRHMISRGHMGGLRVDSEK